MNGSRELLHSDLINTSKQHLCFEMYTWGAREWLEALEAWKNNQTKQTKQNKQNQTNQTKTKQKKNHQRPKKHNHQNPAALELATFCQRNFEIVQLLSHD